MIKIYSTTRTKIPLRFHSISESNVFRSLPSLPLTDLFTSQTVDILGSLRVRRSGRLHFTSRGRGDLPLPSPARLLPSSRNTGLLRNFLTRTTSVVVVTSPWFSPLVPRTHPLLDFYSTFLVCPKILLSRQLNNFSQTNLDLVHFDSFFFLRMSFTKVTIV